MLKARLSLSEMPHLHSHNHTHLHLEASHYNNSVICHWSSWQLGDTTKQGTEVLVGAVLVIWRPQAMTNVGPFFILLNAFIASEHGVLGTGLCS